MIVLFLAIFLTLFAFILKESKFVAVVVFAFMWILYGWNSYNGDYDAYEKIYNSSLLSLANENYEIGFRLLCVGGNLLGFSFQQFLAIIAALILILWLRFILKYAIYPALVSILFFWVFFPLDYVLLRNFLAFSIVLQGIACLMDDTKYKYLKYSAFVLLAFTIHSSSIFYLSFLLLFLKGIRPIKFLNVLILVLFGVVIYKAIGQGVVIGLLSSSGSRDEFYQSNLITFLSLFIYQLLGTFFIVYVYSEMKARISNRKDQNLYVVLLNINILIFFVTILYFDFSIFVRLYRNVAIVNCIFITNGFMFFNKEDVGKQLKIAFFFVCYLVFFFNYFITPFMDDTILALFKYNLLLS